MSILLRSMLVLSVTSLLLVGCGKSEETEPVEAAPVVEPAAAPAATSEAGGYVPTADERVPGITLDAAAMEAAKPAEDAPAVATPEAE
jgi:hypothetical protein